MSTTYPILAPNSTWYNTTVNRNTITQIDIVNSYTPLGTVKASWDASAAKDGSIIAYIEGTKLTIAGNGSGKISANADSTKTFNGFTKLVTLNGGSLLDTANVTTMFCMFQQCFCLKTVDVSNWDTGNVTSMRSMFYGTRDLEELDVSGWNTGKVQDFYRMFSAPTEYANATLTTLDVGSWDTRSAINMSQMFANLYAIKHLDVSNWNTSNVTDMSHMFHQCCEIEELDVSKWDVSKVTTFRSMFSHSNNDSPAMKINNLDVSHWDTSSCTDMSFIFYGCEHLSGLGVSNWDVSRVTTMKYMFCSCKALTELDVSNWDTSSVTDMSYMFEKCFALETLDVSHWDTGKVTTFSAMFQGGSYGSPALKIKELDVSNWDTSSCTDMGWMFYGCTKLNTINVGNWDVSKVVDFDHMFAWSDAIVEGTGNWVTTSAINLNAIFHTIGNTTIDVSKFDTRNVQFFSQMFECGKIGSKLTEIIGLENFDTSNGLGFSEMFRGCSSIKNLNLSSFDTTKATSGATMPNNDTSRTMIRMFDGMDKLETITIGDKFSFDGDGTTSNHAAILPTPDATNIDGADGNWYTLDLTAYAPENIPNKIANTYYASFLLARDVDILTKNGVFIDIAASIRNQNGEETKYHPSEMSEAIDALSIGSGGYDEGKQDEYDRFWNILQNNGNAAGVNYYYKFAYSSNGAGWTDENFNPKYPLICATGVTGGACLFYANTGITDTKVPIVVLGNNTGSTFYNARKLVTIRKLTVNKNTAFTNTFQNNDALENIVMDGEIGQDFDIHWSTKLTKASIESIMATLSTATTGKSVSFSKTAVNKAFETSEGANDGSTSTEWTTLTNTKTNWTISLA